MILDNNIWQNLLSLHNPIWTYFPEKWEKGLPLGNGTMGVMIWGNENFLFLTIDNTQFWDRTSWTPPRPENFKWEIFKELIKEGKVGEKEIEFQNPGNFPRPTRIPPSRMDVSFEKKVKLDKMELDLYNAIAYGRFFSEDGELSFRAFIHPEKDIFTIEFRGNILLELNFRFFSDIENTPINLEANVWRNFAFKEWIEKFQKFTHIKKNDIEIWSQIVPDGGEVSYGIKTLQEDNRTILYVSTAYDREGKSAKESAYKLVQEYSQKSLEEIIEYHKKIWNNYYEKSFISIPETRLEGLYWMELYKLRCCTREDAPPISLHGPWSPDGIIPPWGGDYHHNINVQMSYWPIYASNHLELGFSLYNFIKNARLKFREFCKQFFEREGEFVPHATDIDGNPVYDWASGQFEFNSGPWLAHHLWLHWLYSKDINFLRNYTYPFMKEVIRPLTEELEEGDDGLLHFTYSFSPEYSGFTGKFWGPDATCDLAFMKWLLESLLEIIKVLDIRDEEEKLWREVLARLASYPTFSIGKIRCLGVRADLPLQTSHRHHSHLIPIHPLHLLIIEGSIEDKLLIRDSIRQLIFMGHGEWVGFSFSWAASIFACTGYPNLARTMLLDYTDRMITENTFMMQGPQGGCDMSIHGTYALTLEGGFGAANALLEMLLQSYGKVIRLFPGTPECWQDAVFHNLRVEGAYLVSAVRKEGKCIWARIFAEKDGIVTVKGDFGTDKIKILDSDKRLLRIEDGREIPFILKQGEEVFLISGDIDPFNIKIEPVKGKEWEYHFFGVKDRITGFPRL